MKKMILIERLIFDFMIGGMSINLLELDKRKVLPS